MGPHEQWVFFAQLVANLGFPIAITIYLLASFQKRIERLHTKMAEIMQLLRDRR
ncbi:MAG TPA: YvrJ family protein [Bacilli bacterium]